jgi:hypothetical protein
MNHLAAALLLLLVPSAAFAQTEPNFSGTWILDVARSSIMPRPELPIEPETLIVVQSGKELRWERQVAGETTKQAVLFDYPTATRNQRSDAIGAIQASWKQDVLILTGLAETPESQRSRRANKGRPPSPIPSLRPSFTPRVEPASILTWALSDGGKTLTIQGMAVRKWSETNGDKVSEEIRSRWVYRRQ